MSKDTKGIKKYIGDVRGIKVKNILYFKQRFVGKHGKKHLYEEYWATLERANFFYNNKRHQKRHHVP
jgi:hypothetical protein